MNIKRFLTIFQYFSLFFRYFSRILIENQAEEASEARQCANFMHFKRFFDDFSVFFVIFFSIFPRILIENQAAEASEASRGVNFKKFKRFLLNFCYL